MKKIDGEIFKQMILSANNNIFNHSAEVDQLNVFPIPDGDTGTNMNITFNNGAQPAFKVKSKNISEVAQALKSGLLFGACGNSGSILSQIFRGFYESVIGKEECNAEDIADAFLNASKVAYSNVKNPVEGTILTVIRESSSALSDRVKHGMHISEVFDILLEEAKDSLNRTPDLLPMLKEAGVIDSGGQGLVYIIEGMQKALHNKVVERNMADVVTPRGSVELNQTAPKNVQSLFKHEEFGYCTEFIIRLATQEQIKNKEKNNFNKKSFDGVLEAHGNSIVSVHDDGLVKVHVHTLHPGYILTYAQKFGEFIKIKVENMTEQHSHLLEDENESANTGTLGVDNAPKQSVTREPLPHSKVAMIAVCNGTGIEKIFKESGVQEVIFGGQTMNPQAQDFVEAIKYVNADDVFIFPNNSNIIMTAEQSASLVEGTNVHVVPTKSIPLGISCCITFSPEFTVEQNLESMQEVIDNVVAGEVTYAVKSTVINGVEIKEGQYMALHGKKVAAATDGKIDALKALIDDMCNDDSELVSIYYGEDVTEEELEAIEELAEEYSDRDISVETFEGNQPVYSFYVSVE